ncbi:Gti1/Pac2 family-domain-containing protein [Absidia repens]|uniref:Gti1/Pac2 family-domain-containing protein n=1 Tax=Absidia repens TaxID=90262 RepID=A0A1X2IRQ8_9FUNG|nr:Gti1/Pac2 family-domain-containing protein [Absidia repens]
METFIGHIKTPQDALIIFEACRRGMLHRVKRRLSTKERMNIQSGSIFAFDEGEAGMRRWTDGRTWSPSRVLGSFLTYRELDTKRRPRRHSTHSSSSSSSQDGGIACSYKANGLIKQSFSICTASNQKMHLISYYSKADVIHGHLTLPSMDPNLNKIVIPKGFYPELNPLDTSGGHSATLHLMMKASIDKQQQQQQQQQQQHQQQYTNGSIWKPYPLQAEDARQLEALKTQLRI